MELLFSIRTNHNQFVYSSDTNYVQTNRNAEGQIRFISLIAIPWPERKKYGNKHKQRFETNLYMHNTKGDVAMMNISREKKKFHDLVQCPKL